MRLIVPIVALETHGMNCFYQSISINPGRWNQDKTLSEDVSTHTGEGNVEYVHLHRLNSLASSLGASSPSAGVVKQALDWPGGVKCVSVPDEFSMQAAVLFAGALMLLCLFADNLPESTVPDLSDEHKMNVELACSTTLVPAYHPEIFHKLVPNAKNIVFIVCGGFKVSVNELARYQTHVIEATGREWAVLCDGMQWKVSL
jgi:L-serine/L-threonine ammonia-lyase